MRFLLITLAVLACLALASGYSFRRSPYYSIEDFPELDVGVDDDYEPMGRNHGGGYGGGNRKVVIVQTNRRKRPPVQPLYVTVPHYPHYHSYHGHHHHHHGHHHSHSHSDSHSHSHSHSREHHHHHHHHHRRPHPRPPPIYAGGFPHINRRGSGGNRGGGGGSGSNNVNVTHHVDNNITVNAIISNNATGRSFRFGPRYPIPLLDLFGQEDGYYDPSILYALHDETENGGVGDLVKPEPVADEESEEEPEEVAGVVSVPVPNPEKPEEPIQGVLNVDESWVKPPMEDPLEMVKREMEEKFAADEEDVL